MGGVDGGDIISAFIEAAGDGHLDAMQWLYDLGGVDGDDIISPAFIEAAGDGHLDVMQWLYGLGGVDRDDIGEASSFAEDYGYSEVIDWLDEILD